MPIFQLIKQFKRQIFLGPYSKHHDRGFLFRAANLLIILLTVLTIHSVSMVFFDGLSLGDAFWMSLTSVTTVGYGDFAPKSLEGRLITIITIYIIGIAILAQLAGEFFESRINIRDMKTKGLWRWKHMNDHILIINTPIYNREVYLSQLAQQIRKTPQLENTPIQILTQSFPDGLPPDLLAHEVVHYTGLPENDDNLIAAGADKAKYIVLLSKDHSDPSSDSLTFDVLSRIQQIGTNAFILAEATRDENRQRLLNAGANVVIRPIRAYPELLVRSMTAPGSETIMENMFRYDGDHMERYDIEFTNKPWGDLICQFIQSDKGIPLGYIDDQGAIVSNPEIKAIVSGKGIMVLINNRQSFTQEEIQACLL